MEATHTALIAAVPAAEPAVSTHRAALDPAASWGVPAHITLIYPFLPPDRITAGTLATLRQITAAQTAFDLTLDGIGWFGDTVAWVNPEPAQPFRDLTTALTAAFPQAPPYGGAFDDIVPHLTIGERQPRAVLQAAADQVTAHLPITTRITEIHLITGRPAPGDNWHLHTRLPLGN
jgi:2'-5' RNA ligase